MNSEKLQKAIASRGLASRRQAEKWIASGRVSVNGRLVGVGTRVFAHDVIRVDGHILAKPKSTGPIRVLLYNKAEGEICSKVKENNLTSVFAHLPNINGGRWIAAGRLDVNTSGLIIFTDNGEFANFLMHPRNQIERAYAVRVLGEVSQHALSQLSHGVLLEDGMGKFNAIKDCGGQGANHWYEVILTQGRKREVRRLWESQGLQVSRLIRTRFGSVSLPRYLRRSRWQELNAAAVKRVLSDCRFRPDNH